MNNSGITNFNVLNTNFLYIQGLRVDFFQSEQFLQGEIDAIEQQIVTINSIVNRIDFTQAPALVGDLVITEDNKNSVLLTAIQALQSQIGNINKLDLTALPAAPPASCIITPTTTNQALKSLIDTNTSNIATNTSNISTIQGQITTINNNISAINAKLAHFSTFNYGADVMSGIADGTGFAAAVTNGADYPNGNGIWVRPNTTTQTEQIVMATAYDKEILIRGGNAVKIYGGDDGSITNRNLVELGDKTDNIKIGTNNGGVTDYPTIDVGVDGTLGVTRDSTLNLNGDIYFSRSASSTGATYIAPYTPVLVADTSVGVSFGNCNNFTTDPTFSGLDVVAIAGIAPITLTAGVGNIPVTAAVGLISLTALAGGITLATGAGIMTLNCGAGGFLLNGGAGVMNFAGGSADINMTTITSNITLGAGKGLGVTNSGNTILNAKDNVIIQPDVATEIYKTEFIEMNVGGPAPPAVTSQRIYDISGALYYNGQMLTNGQDPSGVYVLRAGDTMTGTLYLPEAATSILTLTNLTSPPTPVTDRLYLLNGVLTFNGVAVGGGGNFLPLTGGTLTGALNIQYDAGQTVPQLNLSNTNNTAPAGGQGAQIAIRNDAVGAGSIGERCGAILFQAKDSVSAGGRTYSQIQGFINDPTSTAIDGRFSVSVVSNNTMTEMLRLVSTSTSVRQINLAATNTIIGATAIGAATTDTLRVQGSTSITTTLDVPLIQNAPAIYPALSNTLVDGAVKRYRPERIYKLLDYPNPLGGPSIDGEKVIVLNSGGNPVNIADSIIQASDFPQIAGASFVRISQVKYVDATNFTPAMNVVTAIYNEPNQRVHIFLQPDVAGVLSLIHVATVYFNQGQALISDFCVTSYQSTTRIYAGGQFELIQIPAPYTVTATVNNFTGQLKISWSSGTITNISPIPMTSNYSPDDAGTWNGAIGVNAFISSVIDATGYSGIPQPPTTGANKYDSIVIGGVFTEVGTTGQGYRPLKRLAYYDWYNGTGTQISLVNNPLPFQFLQIIGQGDQTATFTIATTGSYNITATDMIYTTSNPSGYAASFGIYYFNGSSSQLVSSLFPFQIDQNSSGVSRSFTTGYLTLNATAAGTYYWIGCNIPDTTPVPSDVYVGLSNTQTNDRCCIATAIQAGPPIGWRSFQSTSWATPEGPDDSIAGGALLDNGGLVFAYNGTTITTSSGSITSNYAFGLQYSNGTPTYITLGGDTDAIQTLQTWNYNSYNRNCVTGGNPVLAFGAGNAIAYGEVYLNTGYNNTSNLVGVSFRPTSGDNYEMVDSLIVNSGFGFPTEQLRPQFSSQDCYAVYRDDTKYQNVYYIARGNQLQTATLPWTGSPNYDSIQLNPTTPIPCYSFGGYSDEVGYQGALFVTNSNLYVYKLTAQGELVIELSGCVVRTFNDVTPSQPIVATNKLTFPTSTDGGSVTLCGDTSTTPVSWWAISQDGPLYYDNTLIGGSGAAAVTSVSSSGAGISVSPTTGAVIVSNTGVTELTAGSGISISAQTGQVTLTTRTGMIRFAFDGNPLDSPSNHGVLIQNNNSIFNAVYFDFDFSTIAVQTGLAVSGNWTSVGNGIIWNGPNPINVICQVCVDVSLYQLNNQTGNYDLMRFEDFNNALQNHIAFGHVGNVVTNTGSNVNNASASFQFNMNQTNNNFYGIVTPATRALSGTFTFNTQLAQGQILKVGCLGNIAWNTAAASGTYRALFTASSQASGNLQAGGITVTINEMPFS